MPALVLHGYRTIIAGDDLGLLSVTFIAIRLTQIGLSIPTLLFLREKHPNTKALSKVCQTLGFGLSGVTEIWDELLYTYTLSTMIIALVSILLDIATVKTSYTGTLTCEVGHIEFLVVSATWRKHDRASHSRICLSMVLGER
uniref:Uncharacterized protein n=1 Tax=Ditylum brightwellii TaxID=49249 RepID=A0A6V2G058_9STRA